MTDAAGLILLSSMLISTAQARNGSCEVNFTYGGPESGMMYFCRFVDGSWIGGEAAHQFLIDMGVEARAGLRVRIENGRVIVTDIFKGGRK